MIVKRQLLHIMIFWLRKKSAFIVSLSFTVIFLCLCKNVDAKSKTYRAAVVEFNPSNDSSGKNYYELVLNNTQLYVNLIEEAAKNKSDIIVFPKNGLTDGKLPNQEVIARIASKLPRPGDTISPCNNQDTPQSTILVFISCAVQIYQIYAVINLIEKQTDSETSQHHYYNTNVVFNRNGTVILAIKNFEIQGSEILKITRDNIPNFTTDFGVTFGVLFSADFTSGSPYREILLSKKQLFGNFVYPKASVSILPFYASLSLDHGFALANGVNLLSANVNNPSEGLGGSSILLADGSELQSFISGKPASQLLMGDVPISAEAKLVSICRVSKNFIKEIDIDLVDSLSSETYKFNFMHENMENYVYKIIDSNTSHIEEVLCGSKTFCCSFSINVTHDFFVPTYIYMLVAHQQTKQFSFGTFNVVKCGVVACAENNVSSCGIRLPIPPAGITFQIIEIRSNFTNANTYVQPATLDFDMKATSNYTFCDDWNESGEQIYLATSAPQDDLLTFGIIGISSLESSNSLKFEPVLQTYMFLIIFVLNVCIF